MNIHDEYAHLVFTDLEYFQIDSFGSEEEIAKIEEWYNKIGKTFEFEKTDIFATNDKIT